MAHRRPDDVREVRARLQGRVAEIRDLQHVTALASWDRLTMMPSGGHEGRGQQLATLAALIHERLSAEQLTADLDALDASDPAPGSDDAATVREVRRAVRRTTAVPAELVRALSLATSTAQRVWVRAREENDFAAFAGPLDEVIRLRREEADAVGWTEHRYDALHDEYEPGSTKAALDAVFGPLRGRLVELLDRVRGSDADASDVDVNDDVLRVRLERADQEAYVRRLVVDLGYDMARGRLDPTVHPFCQSVGAGDVRIATRYDERFLPTALFGTVHEAGHAMYEQGIPEADRRTVLGSYASLGVHESQSRLWENHVARSRPFWEGRYPDLRASFPGAFDDVPLDRFVAAVHRVAPSLIRVEADEVSYPLHVLLRYDLEVALIEGTLGARDLPEAWNAGMRELLGIEPPNDRLGCLQDVHWSMGAFGYFPTYALGSMMSAQLWKAAERALPTLGDDLRAGDFAPLLDWLRASVHVHGARLEPDALVRRATGAPLGPEAYLAHLTEKVDTLVDAASASHET